MKKYHIGTYRAKPLQIMGIWFVRKMTYSAFTSKTFIESPMV